MARLVYQNVAAPDISGSLTGFGQFGRGLAQAAEATSGLFANIAAQRAADADRIVAERALRFQDPTQLQAALADGSLIGDQSGRISAPALASLGQSVGARTTQGVNLDALTTARTTAAARTAAQPGVAEFLRRAASGNAANTLDAATGFMDEPGVSSLPIADQVELYQKSQGLLDGAQGFSTRDRAQANAMQDRQAQMDLAKQSNYVFGNSYDGRSALSAYGASRGTSDDPRVEAALRAQLSGQYPEQFLPGAQSPDADGGGRTGGGGYQGAARSSGGNSRGERNNNQGNIEDRGQFKGMPGYLGSDGRFARFESAEAGQQAQHRQLERYMDGKTRTANNPNGAPRTTVAQIVEQWSPQDDPTNQANSTANYARYVAQRLGVDPNAQLTKADIPRLASAMSEFETGNTARGQLANPLTAANAIADVARADTMANANSSNRALEVLAASQESRSDAAGRLTGEGGAFQGYSRGEIAQQLKDIEARGKVNPAQAARILEDSLSGRGFLPGVARSGFNPLNWFQSTSVRNAIPENTWDNAQVQAGIDGVNQIRQDGSANRDRQATGQTIDRVSQRTQALESQIRQVRARATQLKSKALFDEADRLQKQLETLNRTGNALSGIQQGTQSYTATDLSAPERERQAAAQRAAELLRSRDGATVPNVENMSALEWNLYSRGLLPDLYFQQ